ncbi:MAG: hypothetical protein FK731_15585, partial [Asgard group archaeon]|nr:hypothetical protein [Asgard group archaeon]
MPIPVTSFPMLSFQQALPSIAGAQAGIGMIGDILKQQQLVGQLPYQRPTLEAQLAELRQRPALTAAQTSLAEQQAKFTPLQYALQAQKQQQLGSRFGPLYQLARMVMALPQATRSQWIKENPGLWDVLSQAGTQALQPPEGVASPAVQQLMQQLIPGAAQAQPQVQGLTLTPDQMQKVASQLQTLQKVKPAVSEVSRQVTPEAQPVSEQYSLGTESLAPGFTLTPPQTAKLEDAAALEANEKAVVPQMNRRAQNAVQLEKWSMQNRDEMAPMVNQALEYAGAKGKGQRYFDSWLNKNPDATSSWDWYNTTFTTSLSNAIRLMEGMGATDQQKKELQGMIMQANNILSNPKRAGMAINKMMNTFSEITDSVLQAAEPLNKGVYRKVYDLPPPFKGDYLDVG